jgi:dynein heavy chain
LSPENAKNASSAIAALREWMVQIESFSINTKVIKPKRLALAQQMEKLAVALAQLAEAEGQLEVIRAKCDELDATFRKTNAEKNEIEEQARRQKKQIDQANRLINGLSDERERWHKGANELAEKKRKLIGNVGLSTAFISYCGPFNSEFRDFIANEKLIGDLRKMNLPYETTIYQELTSFLVDEATVGQWNLDGLPKDNLSIQNGIMVSESERYPLIIDPQGQGTYWIKNKFTEVRIANINAEKKFRDALNATIELGIVLMIEGIEGEVDPILDPVLEKQTIKKGKS